MRTEPPSSALGPQQAPEVRAAPEHSIPRHVAWRPVGGAVLAALLALVFGWHDLALSPEPGLDPSWRAALHVAAGDGLDFGRDVVYTYGPLGFLKVPELWQSGTGWLALAYDTLLRLTFLATAFALMGRAWHPIARVLILAIVASQLEDAALPLGFVVAFWLITGDGSDRARRWAAAGLGVVGGLEALAKLNTGVAVIVLAAFAVALAGGRERLRLGATLLGCAALTAAVGWLLTGQSVTAIPGFLINSARVISGHSAAMGLETPGLEWHYGAALVVFLAGAYTVWRRAEGTDAVRRAGALLLFAALAFVLFKQGFARHSHGHAIVYFSVMLAVLAALPCRRGDRALGLLAAAVPLVVLLSMNGERTRDLVNPLTRAGNAVEDLRPLVSSAERREIFTEAQDRVQEAQGLDARTLAELRGRTVHVVPTETSVVAVNDLEWRPLPVFQDYVAYTSGLDALNAERLLSDKAPERLLFERTGRVDGRLGAWDPPAQQRAMLCRYVPVRAQDDRWLVLARAANRCGPERLVGSRRFAWGERVVVPPPSAADRMTYMRLAGVGVQGLERVRSLVDRALERHMRVDGQTGSIRVVPGTAGDGLLLSAPRGADLPAPFSLAPRPAWFELVREGSQPSGRPLRADFYEVQVQG